jgi:hypothetical protein
MQITQIKAYVTKDLRRRAFAAFAMADTNFSRWTREALEHWLQEHGTSEPSGSRTAQAPAPKEERQSGGSR